MVKIATVNWAPEAVMSLPEFFIILGLVTLVAVGVIFIICSISLIVEHRSSLLREPMYKGHKKELTTYITIGTLAVLASIPFLSLTVMNVQQTVEKNYSSLSKTVSEAYDVNLNTADAEKLYQDKTITLGEDTFTLKERKDGSFDISA